MPYFCWVKQLFFSCESRQLALYMKKNLVIYFHTKTVSILDIYETKYSRMDQVKLGPFKFLKDSL